MRQLRYVLIVLMPPGTVAVTEPLGSADVQQLIAEQGDVLGDDVLGDDVASQVGGGVGGGETIPGGKSHVMEKSGKFTTPSLPVARPQGAYPTAANGAYPAIMYLCDMIVESPGISYNENDKIVIEPNAGATAVPKYNSNGGVESVKITSGGEGFTQIPDVYIISETGYNAELKPVFCPDRIAKDEVKEYNN